MAAKRNDGEGDSGEFGESEVRKSKKSVKKMPEQQSHSEGKPSQENLGRKIASETAETPDRQAELTDAQKFTAYAHPGSSATL